MGGMGCGDGREREMEDRRGREGRRERIDG